ncbi:hypothetical protein [Piscirickettsia litoralis]|uniref:Uncharacterized protein n=1 Tax=Piscirickettsia litoralis TaxID=1891921 RepID=A0ABX3A0X1_9GAMM|nr:hypothetical protein [Piscirickettsia litoralis]ODN42120.1 hypothetical protein BGC07_03115 [Piscirickettsia litoralis]
MPEYVLIDNEKEGSIRNGDCGYNAYALGLMSYLCESSDKGFAKEIWARLGLSTDAKDQLNRIIDEKNGFMSLETRKL